jgi:hypothetical protein
MALGSTQPLTEMSTRNILGGKERPARRADNLTAIYEPVFTTLWASTACYRGTFTLLCLYNIESFTCISEKRTGRAFYEVTSYKWKGDVYSRKPWVWITVTLTESVVRNIEMWFGSTEGEYCVSVNGVYCV